ncbi:MAG: CoA transferase [Gammaproteobacteria bacterium]|nr:CoA transferase [Gammaproteobacteria bacterium]
MDHSPDLADGPLAGVRVVDLTSMISGPVATMMLADQGADVIKVEPPGGDLVRAMGANRGGVSATFVSANRSKRSVVLDLKTDAGLDALKRLVRTADVFVQNFRPGAIERMGLGEDVLRAEREDLVYVSISGFGEQGPYAGNRVYDPVIQALSGLAAIQADADGRPQHGLRTIIPDKLTAVTAAQAITAALFARERSGRGQHVRLAMLDATVAFASGRRA